MAKTKTKRVSGDAYLTPPKLAKAMVSAVMAFTHPRTILEPSAGRGAFIEAMLPNMIPGTIMHAVEPNARSYQKLSAAYGKRRGVQVFKNTYESFAASIEADRPYDLIIGNPPFSRAEEHLKLSLWRANHVAFLLRLSFLGSVRRAETIWNSEHGLRALIPLAQRPAFVRPSNATKTDNSEYGIFIWQRFYNRPAEVLKPLFWK